MYDDYDDKMSYNDWIRYADTKYKTFILQSTSGNFIEIEYDVVVEEVGGGNPVSFNPNTGYVGYSDVEYGLKIEIGNTAGLEEFLDEENFRNDPSLEFQIPEYEVNLYWFKGARDISLINEYPIESIHDIIEEIEKEIL